MEDLIIGAHVNFNKNEQLVGCVKQALDYKATTFMFYTGAPQNTVRVSIDDNLTSKAKQMMVDNNIDINKTQISHTTVLQLE